MSRDRITRKLLAYLKDDTTTRGDAVAVLMDVVREAAYNRGDGEAFFNELFEEVEDEHALHEQLRRKSATNPAARKNEARDAPW